MNPSLTPKIAGAALDFTSSLRAAGLDPWAVDWKGGKLMPETPEITYLTQRHRRARGRPYDSNLSQATLIFYVFILKFVFCPTGPPTHPGLHTICTHLGH